MTTELWFVQFSIEGIDGLFYSSPAPWNDAVTRAGEMSAAGMNVHGYINADTLVLS